MKKYILSLLSAMLLLNACSVKEPEFVRLKDLQIISRTDSLLLANVKVEMRNENRFDIKADNFRYKISINNVHIGDGQANKEVVLKSQSISTIENKVKIKLAPLLEIAEYVLSCDSIPIDIDVTGEFTTFKFNVAKQYTFYLQPNKLLEPMMNDFYKIRSVKLVSGNLRTSDLQFDIQIHNQFPIDFEIIKVDVDVLNSKNQKELIGEWHEEVEYQLFAGQMVTIPALVQVKNLSMAKSLFQALLQQKLSYFLKGTIKIRINQKTLNIPLAYDIEVIKND